MAQYETQSVTEQSTEPRESRSSLTRYAGLAAILGGGIFVVPWTLGDPAVNVAILSTMVVGLLVGLGGLHVTYRRSYGWLATAAVALIALGLVTVTAGAIGLVTQVSALEGIAAGDLEAIPDDVIVAVAAVALGLFVVMTAATGLGVAFWRRGLATRLVAGLLIASLPALIVGTFFLEASAFGIDAGEILMTLPFGLAMVALGYHLWSGGVEGSAR